MDQHIFYSLYVWQLLLLCTPSAFYSCAYRDRDTCALEALNLRGTTDQVALPVALPS